MLNLMSLRLILGIVIMVIASVCFSTQLTYGYMPPPGAHVQPPGGEIVNLQGKGYIDAVELRGDQYVVRGWACFVNYDYSIRVRLYTYAADGKKHDLGYQLANLIHEQGVTNECGTTSVKHRFEFPLSRQNILYNAASPIFASIFIYSGPLGFFDYRGSYELNNGGSFNVPTQPVTVQSEGWENEYESAYAMIGLDGIQIPIKVSETYRAVNPNYGVFSYKDGMFLSATRSTQSSACRNYSSTYGRKPTLFITIPGRTSGTGAGTDPWQDDLDAKLIASLKLAPRDTYQYKHFKVDWHSARNNYDQAEDLAKLVNSFLNRREHDWDVVLVGYSRGGILAHDLSEKIITNSKINNLYTVLLDPTASKISGDFYPNKKAEHSGVNHQGFLFYDGVSFIDLDVKLATQSDEAISGYNDYIVQTESHISFAREWSENAGAFLNHNFNMDGMLAYVLDRKMLGSYNIDQHPNSTICDLGTEVIKLRVKDVEVNIDINLLSNGIEVYGEAHIGEVSVNIYASLSSDGAELQSAFLFSSAQASIKEDQISAGLSLDGNSYEAVLSGDGLHASVQSFGIASVSAGMDKEEVYIGFEFFSEGGEISVDTDDFLTALITGGAIPSYDIVKKVTGGLKKAAGKLKKVWKKISF